ncbi:MAG: LapA family protein [Candidatus Rokubacteria bacterium]|nr:LapA family protein [Candidatus Rokubacteria bacterium]
MQLALVLLTLLLLLAVAVFALQNAQAVTVRFLHWQIESSVAILTLAAMTAGALAAGLLGLATRFRRWTRSRPPAGPAAPGPEAGTPAGPPMRPMP